MSGSTGRDYVRTLPVQFGVVDNEMGDDFTRSVAIAADLGMTHVEVLGLWGTPICEARGDLLARGKAELDRAGLRASTVIAPVFKSLVVRGADPRHLDTVPGWRSHIEDLEAAFDAARALGCSRIRVFSGRRDTLPEKDNPSLREPDGGDVPGDRLAVVTAMLRDAAARAQAQGVTLLVENVRSCWGNSCRNLARVLEAADHPALRAIWDPANDFVSGGDGYPRGYAWIRPWIAGIHVKDAIVQDASSGLTAWECVGHGAANISGAVEALLRDRYHGTVTLETHWHPQGRSKEANSRESFAGLIGLIRTVRGH